MEDNSNLQENNPSPAYSRSSSRSRPQKDDHSISSGQQEIGGPQNGFSKEDNQNERADENLFQKSDEGEESVKQEVKPKKNKKTKKHMDEELARTGVEQLIPKITEAIDEDRRSIIQKQAGMLISPEKTIPPSGG
jgi:hypothetical protein